ncbi:MAG: hypothetical protein CM15mP12_0390 [Gammaproteobacteria bacterium]|nr:MAG: hypothetical protein CM15mP12_0390 [Gammaproteobacteria bacterium]
MKNNKKVIVGISGGVDSSVCAFTLKQAGFDVKGIFMKNWTNPAPNIKCTSEEDFKDAEEVCDQLDKPIRQTFLVSIGKSFQSFLSDHNERINSQP